MPNLTTEELLERRNTAVANMRAVLDRAQGEGRNLSPQEETEFEGWKKEVIEYNSQLSAARRLDSYRDFIKQQEELNDRPVSQRRTVPSIATQVQEPRVINWSPLRDAEPGSVFNRYNQRSLRYNPQLRGSVEYQRAFDSYLRTGNENAFVEAGFDSGTFRSQPIRGPEGGYLQTDDDVRGGYIVPSESFMEGLLKNVDDQTWIYRLARVIIVRQSQSLGIRCLTQKMQCWDWGSELSSALANLDDNMRFGKKVLAPHYATGSARISRDLMRMSVMDVESLVYSEMSRDVSYLIEKAAVNGDGVQKPLGVLTKSADGIDGDRDFSHGTTTTTFSFNTFIKAKYALKPQYRNRARWMFNREHIGDIAKIRTEEGGPGTGMYIWQPSMQVGSPDVLLGLPVDENEFFPTTKAAGAYFGMLAVWEYYVFAVGLDMDIQRLVETRAHQNQVEYVGRVKIDGMPVLSEAFLRLQFAAS